MVESMFLDKLAQLRATNCEVLPTPELAIMARAINRLRNTGITSRCLQVGETAPDFDFLDADNSVRRFYSILEKGPAVINFFRGYWCSYCKTELEAYEDIQARMEAMGCAYLAVSPQRPETADYSPANYQVIFDRDNRIARQFGIVFTLDQSERDLFSRWGLDLGEFNGNSHWELPVPATFVICQDRTIVYKFVDVDFRSRCCPEQLIEEVRSFCNC